MRWTQQRRQAQSARRRAWWTPEKRAEAAAAMRQKWATDAAFRDGQRRRVVARWQAEAYREKIIRGILQGRIRHPSHGPRNDGPPCPSTKDGVPCGRREPHAYHAALVGSAQDWTLQWVGWEDAA